MTDSASPNTASDGSAHERVNPSAARHASWRAPDLAIAMLGTLLVSWLPSHWGGAAWAASLDVVVFGAVGPLLAVLLWRLASQTDERAERRAWRLLAGASVARSASGLVWGQWLIRHPNTSEPAWILAIKWTYLVLTIAALFSFPSATRQAADRPRYRLNLATALVGSAMVSWYFALGPFFSTRSLSTDFLDDFVHAAGDSLCVALAAALHLRATTPRVRRVALWLLAAFVVQVVPDVWFWSTTSVTADSGYDLVSLLWFGAWLFKWMGVRSATISLALSAGARAADDSPALENERTRSPLPTTFLLAATGLQLLAIVRDQGRDETLLAVGSLVLAVLLVSRQYVEMRERDRLQRALVEDAARQRALLNRAYDAIVLLDRDGRLEYASPTVELLFKGISDRARPWALLERVHPDDHAQVERAVASTAPGPRAIKLRIKDRAGAWRMFDGHLQDFRHEPLIDGFVLNGFDRTRELQLEQGLRDAQQFEALGVMASGLAHDLGNTLTVVASHVELMNDDATMSDRALIDLRAIRAASDRARALTAGLSALSRRKSASTTMVAADVIVRERLDERARRTPARIAEEAMGPLVRVNRDALIQLVDVVFDEAHAERESSAEPQVTVDVCDLHETVAGALNIEQGRYVVIGVGDAVDASRASIQSAVRTGTQGEWDLSPGDLALLMAMAAAREIGGTVARERSDNAQRFAIYVPAVAA